VRISRCIYTVLQSMVSATSKRAANLTENLSRLKNWSDWLFFILHVWSIFKPASSEYVSHSVRLCVASVETVHVELQRQHWLLPMRRGNAFGRAFLSVSVCMTICLSVRAPTFEAVYLETSLLTCRYAVHKSCCCSIFRYQVHSHYARTSW